MDVRSKITAKKQGCLKQKETLCNSKIVFRYYSMSNGKEKRTKIKKDTNSKCINIDLQQQLT